LLKNHLMTRDLKYLTLGIGFLAPMLVFSMITAGAIIIALPALAQRDGGGSTSSSIRGGGSAGGGSTSTAITSAQMHLAQAMTALQNKDTAGAMLQLKLLNQSLSTLSTGGVATSGGIPGPGPSTVNPGPGPSGSPSGGSSGSGPSGGSGAGSSGPGISGGGGPGAGSSGAGR
jgi:hypothetical protein